LNVGWFFAAERIQFADKLSKKFLARTTDTEYTLYKLLPRLGSGKVVPTGQPCRSL